MTSFYAGPSRGRLQVSTWNELVSAVQAGSMTETQWVECKLAIPATSPGANMELAKDLASLTVDGGVLVIGVRDKAKAVQDVEGTTDDIETLKDRISSIAGQTRVQPNMHVVFGEPLLNPDGSGRYALLVAVPQSPAAPHMVDGQYWGRTAVGKRPLVDAEVAQLFAQRRLLEGDFESRLQAISSDLDPVPLKERTLAHFSILVRPEIPAGYSFRDQIENRSWMTQTLIDARNGFDYQNSYPSLIDLGRLYSHPDGPAREGTVNPDSDPSDPYSVRLGEAQHMRLLVGSDGAVSVAAARGSYPLQGGRVQIDLRYIAGVLHQVMSLAGVLGRGAIAYEGLWTVGVHVTALRGKFGYSTSGFRSDQGQEFGVDEYLRTEPASTADLAENPVPIIDRVLRDLARASGLSREAGLQMMDPAAPPRF